MLKIKGLKAPNEALTQLSTTYVNKITMKNAKSIAQTIDDSKGLQNTLQKAGKFRKYILSILL